MRIKEARIKDQMDDIFESKGFYRKHVPREPNAIFRSLSDMIFGTQWYADLLRKAYDVHIKANPKLRSLEQVRYGKIQILARLLSIPINVVDFALSSQEVMVIRIFPRPSAEALEIIVLRQDVLDYDAKTDHILLCHCGQDHYDPVYTAARIDNSGLVQSILYQLLYEDLFNLSDSMEAAEAMIYGNIIANKAVTYDKEFQGSALTALELHRIPFPFKVAKALDHTTYRNIEFDVWNQENRQQHQPSDKSQKLTQSRSPRWLISDLAFGTPVLVNCAFSGPILGLFRRLTKDRKYVEVYSPIHDCCFYFMRNQVFPVKANHDSFSDLVSVNGDYPSTPVFSSNSCEVSVVLEGQRLTRMQQFNLAVAASRDPNWINHFNFGVPPPLSPQALDLSPIPSPFYQDPAVLFSVDAQGGTFINGMDNRRQMAVHPIFQSSPLLPSMCCPLWSPTAAALQFMPISPTLTMPAPVSFGDVVSTPPPLVQMEPMVMADLDPRHVFQFPDVVVVAEGVQPKDLGEMEEYQTSR